MTLHPVTSQLRTLCAFCLTAVLFSMTFVSGASAEVIDGVAAKINSDIITYYEVDKSLKPYLLQRGMSVGLIDDTKALPELQRRVLESLIERQLIAQEAKRLNTKITDAEVNRNLEFAAKQQKMTSEQFQAAIEEFGVSWKDYREITRSNLLRLRIMQLKVGTKVSISPAEVDAAYKTRYGVDGDKEVFIDVSHVLIQPKGDSQIALDEALKRAQEAKARIDSGESFEEVATSASDGPSAQTKGRIGEFKRGDLDPQFEKYAFNMKAGEISEVVQTKYGYHIIMVSGRKEQENPDVESRKNAIMGELRQVEMMRQYKTYIKGLKGRAFVDVRM